MAKAESSEIVVLPIGMIKAVIRLTHSIRPAPAKLEPAEVSPPKSAVL